VKRVGQILAEARKNKGYSLEQVAEATKIRKQTLAFLESGDWDQLPSPTFVKGLIKNYGSFLDLSTEDLLAFYRREFDEKKVKEKITFPLRPPRFRLTPKLVTGLVAAVSVSAVIVYLFIQYRSFTGAPLLEVTEPKDNTRSQANEVSVIGRTWPDAILKINGQDVRLAPGGSFSVAVSLAEGINTITITAANRFGKIATEKRTILVDFEGSKSATKSASQAVDIELQIGPASASVSIEIDGKADFEGVLVAGATKKFFAKERIRIVTRNAGSTKVLFHGQEAVLGKEGETVEKSFP